MIIIHGEDIVASRRQLNELIEKGKAAEGGLSRFEARQLDLTKLTQVLEGLTLFGQQPTIIIEGLFSLPKSKTKDLLCLFISKYQERNLLLYEDKGLSAAVLKTFNKAKIFEHKPAPTIFAFLDNLRPNSSSKSLELLGKLELDNQPAELIFAMLVRQVRLLIQALEPNALKVAPWQKTRLISQTRFFGEKKLLKLHNNLYIIDRQYKTGKNPLDLSTQIFNLITTL